MSCQPFNGTCGREYAPVCAEGEVFPNTCYATLMGYSGECAKLLSPGYCEEDSAYALIIVCSLVVTGMCVGGLIFMSRAYDKCLRER